MKKYIGLLSLLFGSVSLFAAGPNSISFVTTLSSPQGVFSQLDASILAGGADSGKIPTLNFCTQKGINNQIMVLPHKDTVADAKFRNFTFNRSGSELFSESVTGFYFTGSNPTFTMRSTNDQTNVILTVGRLFLNNLTLPTDKQADLKVQNTLYTYGIYSKVAKVESIRLPTSVWFPNGPSDADKDTTGQGAKWLAPANSGLKSVSGSRCKSASNGNVADANCRVLAVPLN